ncbi:MAG TPA: HAD family hydrolase [Terrimicrobiaceae bacterium]
MTSSAPKVILFDFGGTLDADGVPWKQRFYPLYCETGLGWDLPTFERFFHASDDSLNQEKLGDVSYQAMLLEQVSRVLRNGNRYEKELAHQIANRFYADSLRCLNGNMALLEGLSKQYRLGIVSNFYGNLEFLCQEIGYTKFFSIVIDSARVGVTKPNVAIFEAALDKLNCPPQEALFVGDNPDRDMAPAKALSMPHVWLNTLHPDRPPCCENDLVIRSLTGLANLLK